MGLYNVTEALVKEAFSSAYRGPGRLQCACERCMEDILAIALNNLTTHYVSTDQGYAYVKAQFFDQQMQSDVLRELAFAARTVGERPRHGVDKGVTLDGKHA